MNGEEVRLIPVPAAHTDGDTMIYFVKADVLMTGDFSHSTGYPNIDRNNGGTLKGMIEGSTLSSTSPARTPASCPATGLWSTRKLWKPTAMTIALGNRVMALVMKGQTQEQMLATSNREC